MSIEIVIIPISAIFEPQANHIYSILKVSVKDVSLELDTNYFASLKARISKHRRKNKDIVLIDHDFINSDKITIRFAGVGNNVSQMPVQELVELITTLQEEEDEASKHENLPPKLINDNENEITNNNEDKNESNCLIM